MLRIRLLEADNKRLMCMMELIQTRDGYLAATMEQLSLHVNLDTRRATPFPDALAQRLARTVEEHAAHPLPKEYRRLLPLKGAR